MLLVKPMKIRNVVCLHVKKIVIDVIKWIRSFFPDFYPLEFQAKQEKISTFH